MLLRKIFGVNEVKLELGACFDCSCRWMQFYNLLQKYLKSLNSQCFKKSIVILETHKYVVVTLEELKSVLDG